MFERNSKFPRFFILMLVPIAIVMLFGMFFSLRFVANSYFIALLIAVVFMMLDRHHGENLTNYKLAFFVFDFINLIATITVIYFEYSKQSLILNILLIALVAIFVILLIVDGVLLKNKNITKRYSSFVNLLNIGTMICILTYFFNVSELFFVIDALVFEISILIIKLIIEYGKHKKNNENKDEFDLVSIIRADEGDLD